MEGNTANDIIIEHEDKEEELKPQQNSMQETIKEMAKTIFEKYPEKSSNLTHENIDGMTQVDVLNEYVEVNFGYRFKTLDKLVESKGSRVMSHNGFGITSIIDFVKSIQATFEQTQIPDGIRGLLRK